MRDRASALLVLQPPLSLSLAPLVLPPQVLWPAQTRGIGRGMLQQWMLLFRKITTRETCFLLVAAAVTGVRFYVNTAETYLSIFNNTTQNIHLGCSTPVCVCPSSGGSGGVFHSRSQCDSGSRLCSRDNHTPSKASVLRWATHRGPVQAH